MGVKDIIHTFRI